jgi:hypothetical protein
MKKVNISKGIELNLVKLHEFTNDCDVKKNNGKKAKNDLLEYPTEASISEGAIRE